MMLGRVEFAPCTGCRTPSECAPYSTCAAGQARLPLLVPAPILATGWICPRCQVVHAPSVQHCTCKGEATRHVHPVYQD